MRRHYLVGSRRRLYESLNFFDLSEDKEHWRAFVNMRVKFVLNEM